MNHKIYWAWVSPDLRNDLNTVFGHDDVAAIIGERIYIERELQEELRKAKEQANISAGRAEALQFKVENRKKVFRKVTLANALLLGCLVFQCGLNLFWLH